MGSVPEESRTLVMADIEEGFFGSYDPVIGEVP